VFPDFPLVHVNDRQQLRQIQIHNLKHGQHYLAQVFFNGNFFSFCTWIFVYLI
jgi:hypothetical protein